MELSGEPDLDEQAADEHASGARRTSLRLHIYVCTALTAVLSVASAAAVAEHWAHEAHDEATRRRLERAGDVLVESFERELDAANAQLLRLAASPESARLASTEADTQGLHAPIERLADRQVRFIAGIAPTSSERIEALALSRPGSPSEPARFRIRMIARVQSTADSLGGALELSFDGSALVERAARAALSEALVEVRDLRGQLLHSQRDAPLPKHGEAEGSVSEVASLQVQRALRLDPHEPATHLRIALEPVRGARAFPMRPLRARLAWVALLASLVGVAVSSWLVRQIRAREAQRLEDLASQIRQRNRLSRELARAAQADHATARVLRIHPDASPLGDLLARALDELLELPGVACPGRMLVFLTPQASRGATELEAHAAPPAELHEIAARGSPPAGQYTSPTRISELCLRAVHFCIPIHEPGTQSGGLPRTPGAAVPIRTGARILGAIYADVESARQDEPNPLDVLTDATEILAHLIDRKLAHDALRRSLDQLEQARTEAISGTRLKDEFLARVSHQLRTPLTSILGFAEFLRDEREPDPDRREAVEVIHANGRHLLAMIAELVDVSRIEAGALPPERQAVNPSALLESVAEALEDEAHAKGIELRCVIRISRDITIETDADRLRSVLLELATESVSQTAAGFVELRVDADRGRERLAFAIRDSGPDWVQRPSWSEVPPDAPRRKDTPGELEPARGSTPEAPPLAPIETRVAELQGTLETRACSAGECELRLELPLRLRLPTSRPGEPSAAGDHTAPTEALPHLAGAGLAGWRILLAEDNEVNRMLVERVLQAEGASVECAPDGAVALQAATEAFDADVPFDAILMDMHMPVLDGLQATERLRGRGFSAPIVALTASDIESDHRRCIEAGCNAVETKPIDRARLVRTLRSLRKEPLPG